MIQAGIWTGRFAAKLNAPVRFAFAAAPCFSRILFAAKSVANPATPQTIAIPIEPLAASPLTPTRRARQAADTTKAVLSPPSGPARPSSWHPA